MKKVIVVLIMLAVLVLELILPINSVKAEAASMKLSNTKVTIGAGEEKELSVENIASTSTVKWSTSDKKIATVSTKGKVTAKKVGKASITATVTVKTGKKSKFTCKVTVKSNNPSSDKENASVNNPYSMWNSTFIAEDGSSVTLSVSKEGKVEYQYIQSVGYEANLGKKVKDKRYFGEQDMYRNGKLSADKTLVATKLRVLDYSVEASEMYYQINDDGSINLDGDKGIAVEYYKSGMVEFFIPMVSQFTWVAYTSKSEIGTEKSISSMGTYIGKVKFEFSGDYLYATFSDSNFGSYKFVKKK